MSKRPSSAKPPRAWQRMLSGRRLDLLDPSPLDIEIEDIAHGLARVARWNGQTTGRWAYSVAEHSLLVERIMLTRRKTLAQRWRLAGLLHDAAEYVIGDMITPFKTVIGSDYKTVEARIQSAVHIRFGLPPILPDDVTATIKRADKIAAFIEATQLAGFSKAESARLFGSPGAAGEIRLSPCAPDEVGKMFLSRFRLLAGG